MNNGRWRLPLRYFYRLGLLQWANITACPVVVQLTTVAGQRRMVLLGSGGGEDNKASSISTKLVVELEHSLALPWGLPSLTRLAHN